MNAKMNKRKLAGTAAILVAAIGASAMSANADVIVTQTINNVEWRFKLNPTYGTATLGINPAAISTNTNRDKESLQACPNVPVDAALIPWTFIGEDDGIHYTVTAVAVGAFYQHTQLTGTLTIPDAVQSIGTSAFQRIGDSLKRLEGCKGVTELGNYVFQSCTSMVGTYPYLSKLTYIGESPFSLCPLLTGELKLGNSLATIPHLGFADSYFSGTAVIPAGVTTMGGNTNYGLFNSNPNLQAIWVKGKATAASQAYTTVYCAKLAASCAAMKMILMGRNTKGARMTQTGGNAMLSGVTGAHVFVPANGYWNGLVTGGTDNKLWYYGPTNEFDLDVNDVDMMATFTPTTVNALTNALAWAPSFKTHFNLDAHISVTNTLDLTGVTIDSTTLSGVTFDRLIFSVKTQAQLTAILAAFPATTPISIDPTGLTENMVIPNDYPNVHVKTVPGVTIKRTASGFVIIVK